MRHQKIEEIQISKEMNKHYIVIIIGILTFLMTTIFIATFNLGDFFSTSKASNTHKITIEIPLKNMLEENRPVEEEKKEETLLDTLSRDQQEKKTHLVVGDFYQKVVTVLKETPSVVRFEKIDPEKLKDTMHKMGHKKMPNEGIDLPILLEVDIASGKSFRIDCFLDKLSSIHPKIHVEYNDRWRAKVDMVTNTLKIVSFFFLFFITICVVTVVTLITQTSIKTHESIIDTLRLLGAKKSYIVNIYQFQAFKSIFFGSIIGNVLTIPVLYIVQWGMKQSELSLLAFHPLSILNIQLLLFIPLCISLLGFFTARRVVCKAFH